MPTDQRLIEDYIPIEAISAEARREKSVRKGHISTLHLWWARRPLVAARAAVYAALVPAPADKEGRKRAEQFVADLCRYPGSPSVIAEARRHILEAHAARLTAETGHLVTAEDIEAGRAPRPRVLDMFAGGGSIPLEALRLGCEAYALDLNPVAHIIELCTLVYPQKYGAPDPAARGCAKDGTWAGLAAEVEHWGKWVLKQVKAEIGDLYPPIPDPAAQADSLRSGGGQLSMGFDMAQVDNSRHLLTPVAYLWTRTVRCKNPACGGTVPLARQTWLAKKKGRYVALRPDAEANRHKSWPEKTVRYHVVEATTEEGLGFDPTAGSRGGNVACPFCGTVADGTYVKTEGQHGRITNQPMAVICLGPKGEKVYLAAEQVPGNVWPNENMLLKLIATLEGKSQKDPEGPLLLPDEPIEGKLADQVPAYGIKQFKDLFSLRQLLVLMSFARHTRAVYRRMIESGVARDRAEAVAIYLGVALDKLALRLNMFCTWATTSAGGRLTQAFGRQALEMTWDFAEANPFGLASGSYILALKDTAIHARLLAPLADNSQVVRGSASDLPYQDNSFDAIITDPPYYDNVFYADLSDFFYIWLKRSLGHVLPAHFSSSLSPKKREIVAAPWRHENRNRAKEFYENFLVQSLQQAHRTLKPNAPLVIVYAHKTTAGWATLVDAMRFAGFTVAEAWPLDTELTGHRKTDTASLASSIFLVARRRESNATGSYERDVRPELERIVRERVDRLWAQGITGADLVIACVGAGLAAFTRYARVEYANGEPVPADSFLAEVEGAVLEALLEKLFGVSPAGVGSVDPVTRFYVLWRYAYRQAAVDAGEAIIFAYPQHVELDGSRGLTAGGNPLVEKKGGKYRLRDFSERGHDEKLGLPREGAAAPLVDVLHRVLWLVEHRPDRIPAYLDEARPDIERLRVVAQTLAGPALSGNGGGRVPVPARGAEAAALRKLTTNWRSLIEAHRTPLA